LTLCPSVVEGRGDANRLHLILPENVARPFFLVRHNFFVPRALCTPKLLGFDPSDYVLARFTISLQKSALMDVSSFSLWALWLDSVVSVLCGGGPGLLSPFRHFGAFLLPSAGWFSGPRVKKASRFDDPEKITMFFINNVTLGEAFQETMWSSSYLFSCRPKYHCSVSARPPCFYFFNTFAPYAPLFFGSSCSSSGGTWLSTPPGLPFSPHLLF